MEPHSIRQMIQVMEPALFSSVHARLAGEAAVNARVFGSLAQELAIAEVAESLQEGAMKKSDEIMQDVGTKYQELLRDERHLARTRARYVM